MMKTADTYRSVLSTQIIRCRICKLTDSKSLNLTERASSVKQEFSDVMCALRGVKTTYC